MGGKMYITTKHMGHNQEGKELYLVVLNETIGFSHQVVCYEVTDDKEGAKKRLTAEYEAKRQYQEPCTKKLSALLTRQNVKEK